jgi:putative phosphoesterase
MKLLVFSDVHGSVPVTERMLALVEAHNPDAVLLLGDVLYHGPRNILPDGYLPKQAAANLAPLAPRIIAIRGNCDSEVDESILPFPLCHGFSWLLMQGSERVIRVCATHGHVYNHHNIPPLQRGDVLLYGHTHVPMAAVSEGGVYLCNPGSLALPKEGSPPCYGLFEDGWFSVFTKDNALYKQVDCNHA